MARFNAGRYNTHCLYETIRENRHNLRIEPWHWYALGALRVVLCSKKFHFVCRVRKISFFQHMISALVKSICLITQNVLSAE